MQAPVSVYTPLFTSFGLTPGHKAASSDGIPVYSFMVAHQHVFHSGHTMSYFPTNCRGSKLYILLTCVFLPSLPSTSGCGGASHWGFDFMSCAYRAEQSHVTFVDCPSVYSAHFKGSVTVFQACIGPVPKRNMLCLVLNEVAVISGLEVFFIDSC